MARSLNKVQLIGHLGGDPEVKMTSTGVQVATFSLATNRQWQGKDGSLQEETDWHTVVAWDRLAQVAAEYLSKGRLVYVEGRIRYRSWETAGQKFYKTEIVATDLLILDSRATGGQETVPAREPVEAPQSAAPPSDRRPAREKNPVVSASAGGRTRSAPVDVSEVEDLDDLPF